MRTRYGLLLAIAIIATAFSCNTPEADIPTPKITFKESFNADYESVVLSCSVTGNVTAERLSIQYAKDKSLAGAKTIALETYYYRYIVENKVSTFTDEKIREFKTLDYIAPVVSTGEVKDISGTKATLEGVIEFACGKEILEKGFFFGKDSNKLEAKPTSESSLTLFIEGLEFETTYYYQAYAKTEIGTGKGEVKEFKTSNAVSFNALTSTRS